MATRKRKLKKQAWILFGAIGLVIILAILGLFLKAREGQIPSNPPGTIGNTPGNLYNGGLVCESDGIVYFANPYDQETLYCMDVDEQNIRQLSTAQVWNILAGGNYIYYFQYGQTSEQGLGTVRVPHGFIRSKKDGKNPTSLTRDVIISAQLVNDTLYLLAQDETAHLYRMQTDKTGQEELINHIVYPSGAQGTNIFYNETMENHHLYAYDTLSGNITPVLNENVWHPIPDGEYVYYMDPSNNYQLRRYHIADGTIEILTNEKVESYNIGNGFIYFQTFGDSPKLMFMQTDGSNPVLLANGNYTNICMTSQKIYFHNVFDSATLYHSTIGSTDFDTFTDAFFVMKDKEKKK